MNFRLLILAILPFFCFILGYGFCSWYLSNTTYPTPDIMGLSIHEAFLKTSPLHINLQLIGQKQHPNATPGTIISQKPAPDRLIKQHQSILIITSKEPEKKTAIDVCKINGSKLSELEKDQNIIIKTYDIPSDLPDGHFIGQHPQANQPMENNTLIIYYAQNNKMVFLMPDVRSEKLSVVLPLLNAYQLPIEIVHNNQTVSEYDADHAYIIAQKPTPACMIDINKKPTIQLAIEYRN